MRLGTVFRRSLLLARRHGALVGAAGASGIAAAILSTRSVAQAEAATATKTGMALKEEAKQIEKVAEEEHTLMQKCVSEIVGTGSLISIGCGSVAALKYANYPIGPWGISAVWGSTVALIVYATGDISGAHLNPAITASLAINKPDEFPKEHVPYYMASQLFGATVASGAVYGLFKDGIKAVEVKEGIKRGSLASTQIYNGAFGLVPNTQICKGPLSVLAIEVWCTAHLAFFVFALTDPDNSVPSVAAPALIGTTVMTLVNVFGPVTGCGMNPARDIGPRIITAMTGWGGVSWHSWWMYTVGPVIGGVLGGALYNSFAKKKLKSKESAK